MITLFKIEKKSLIGIGGESEGDNYNYDIQFSVVKDEELATFQEAMAEEYGNQDYSYGFNCKKVAEFTEQEFIELKNVLLKRGTKNDINN
ncbi:MAG: hypothetical protein WC307_06480 [Candidatus Nanoarchaeia archaeon]|jgi:hypothetical protein